MICPQLYFLGYEGVIVGFDILTYIYMHMDMQLCFINCKLLPVFIDSGPWISILLVSLLELNFAAAT